MSNIKVQSLDELFQERGIDPFESAIQKYSDQQVVDEAFDNIAKHETDSHFTDIIENEFQTQETPSADDHENLTDTEVLTPEVLLPGQFELSRQLNETNAQSKERKPKKPKNRLKRIGKGFVFLATASVATTALMNSISSETEGYSNEDVPELSANDADEQVREPSEIVNVQPQPEQPIQEPQEVNEVEEQQDSGEVLQVQQVTPAPEVEAAPRTLTLLESVASGERTLESIPGTKVGTLSIEGICLDGVDVSVTNAVDPVKYPNLLDGVNWSTLDTNPTIPLQEGDLEGARERLNPLYRLIADETPQQACVIEGETEHLPRWERHTAGSQRAKNKFNTPAELVPQANIHPYSALPGKPGVTYIQGHRTTESAPFMNLDGLVVGQTATFNDGFNTYNYVFMGYEQVSPDININDILNRSIDGVSTMIVSTCDDGDATRLLAKFSLQA